METLKRCNGCGQEKTRSDFNVNRGKKANKDGLQSRCKDCQRVSSLESYYRRASSPLGSEPESKACSMCGNVKPIRQFHRQPGQVARKSACKGCVSQLRKDQYNREDPEARRVARATLRLRRMYDLTLEGWKDMVEKQGGKCPICLRDITLRADVDHDHQTGRVRGILCGPCNSGMGFLGDDPERLLRAHSYLLRHL